MRRTPAVMIQGTSSDAGKSLLVAGLARAFSNRGLRVRPFKPQNMSNNAAATPEGGEIGRAQALQARAARTPLSRDMNPVLLKPESERGAQVVVQGQRLVTCSARDYGRLKPELLPRVLESFERLAAEADLVLVEGAGSPAEVNLRAGDIANMGFALAAGVPVVLAGDIERGGVIASILGTWALLEEDERALTKAYVINKFRGDPALFDAAHASLHGHTGLASIGVVPWFEDARLLPAEDVLGLKPTRRAGAIRIVVPRLPRIANFDDLDPLAQEEDVDLAILEPGEALPGDADLVLIPGSKATINDLMALREEGWDIDIKAHVRRGGRLLGLCGGYQMLGRSIEDPEGLEGPASTVAGLDLLDVTTRLAPIKTVREARATERTTGLPVSGYEIHLGRTSGPDTATPMLDHHDHVDGAITADGRVMGCYMHGLFTSDAFRHAFLAGLRERVPGPSYEGRIETTLDALAGHLERHLDIDGLYAIASSR